MPTLGFLKRTRTKELLAQKDQTTDAPVSNNPTSPITPTTSRGLDNSIETASTQSAASQTQAESQSSHPTTDEGAQLEGEKENMTQSVAHQQQHAYPPSEQKNLPSINNLINPPQHDGASHSTTNTRGVGNEGAPGNNTQPLKQNQPAQAVVRQTKGKYSLGDFEILRTLGTGSFGRVHLVQSKHNQRFYAVKVLKKQQVVKMKQVEHTNDERKMLQEVKHPFLITLWGTFQDSKNLYMVMDFVEGGELFSLLRKSQVRLVVTIFFDYY